MRLDGLAALVQLLVELLAALDGLVVQLGLEPRLVLGVLLEDALGLGAGLAQLPLGVLAELLGLRLGVAQHLLGLVADVGAVVRGPGRDGAARLVELGAQDLDLVTEVLGVLDGLLPLGLQPVHLGFEPGEMVVFSSVALLAFVAPHCAVHPSPSSQRVRAGETSTLVATLHMSAVPRPRTGPGESGQIGRPRHPDLGATRSGTPTGPGPEPPTLPGRESGGQCSAEEGQPTASPR